MKQTVIIYFILGTLLFLASCTNGDGPGNGTGTNCGANIHDSWYDTDNDGITDDTERNNRDEGYHPDFEPDSTCNADPSEAVGTYDNGSLTGGINLPDEFNGIDGYYHFYGTDPIDGDDWGTLELINMIELTGLDFGTTPPVGIGDMSLRNGGSFPPHGSHRNGLDVDVRYVRSDGFATSLDLSTSDSVNYDRDATLQLMQYFVSNGNVTAIFVHTGFADITSGDLSVVSDDAGHYNHFHVRISQ